VSHIGTHRDGAIQRIELNRPEKKNALTREMYSQLATAIDAAEADAAVRVMLLHGAGDAFTAGNDLHDFIAGFTLDDAGSPHRFLRSISHAAKPIVAAVHGAAIGIGTTMLAHCDLVFAAESARFQLPFVNLGICPEAASSVLLPALVGYARATELILLGEPFSARTAREIGFITEVVPDAELLAVATAAARKLADKPPAALRAAKDLLKRPLMPQIEAALAEEAKQFRALVSSPEAKEAFAAFLEKRKPDFSQLR
jgi:enoyl-CoA hydratase/carnithine racemase